MPGRILVVDDEKLIVKGIKFSLEQDGMLVDAAYDGEEALRLAEARNYSLVLLDVMLPRINGLDVCREIREFSNVPVIMVTAKGDDLDKIMGLEYGADDYITKPFNILELKARIKAILRRSGQNSPDDAEKKQTRAGAGLKISRKTRGVFLDGREISLSGREFELLELLMNNPGKVYSRDALLAAVWGESCPGDARAVDVYIRRLREKIEPDPGEPLFIATKWGVGYYFNNQTL